MFWNQARKEYHVDKSTDVEVDAEETELLAQLLKAIEEGDGPGNEED